MSPWQYHVRRGQKLFCIFYQKCTLNLLVICKQWRLMTGVFKHKKAHGCVAPGKVSLFHLPQDQTWIKCWFSSSSPFPSSMPPGEACKGRVKNQRRPMKCCCGLQGCACSFTKTVLQGGMEGPWAQGLSVLYVVCQATGTSSPFLFISMTWPCLWHNTSHRT